MEGIGDEGRVTEKPGEFPTTLERTLTAHVRGTLYVQIDSREAPYRVPGFNAFQKV